MSESTKVNSTYIHVQRYMYIKSVRIHNYTYGNEL